MQSLYNLKKNIKNLWERITPEKRTLIVLAGTLIILLILLNLIKGDNIIPEGIIAALIFV